MSAGLSDAAQATVAPLVLVRAISERPVETGDMARYGCAMDDPLEPGLLVVSWRLEIMEQNQTHRRAIASATSIGRCGTPVTGSVAKVARPRLLITQLSSSASA